MTGRPAAALASVLLALSIASALAVGGAYVARRAAADVRSQRQMDGMLPAAEKAIVGELAAWDSVSRTAQPVGTAIRVPSSAEGELETGLWVTRIANAAYWLVAESCRRPVPRFCRRVGAVVIVVNAYPTIASGGAWSNLP